jgi:hypothetical protein
VIILSTFLLSNISTYADIARLDSFSCSAICCQSLCGTVQIVRNSIQEEIKSRLNSDNVCDHSVQNILSSRLLSKNVKIKIYKTIILPLVLYGCRIWSLILREEYRLRSFENSVLGRIFGAKRDEVTGGWRKVHNEELHNLYS